MKSTNKTSILKTTNSSSKDKEKNKEKEINEKSSFTSTSKITLSSNSFSTEIKNPNSNNKQILVIKNQKTPNSSDIKTSFVKKINLAKATFDYSDNSKDLKLKSERLEAINSLIEMMNDQKLVTSIIIPQMDLLMEMITRNIFRPLPSLSNKTNVDKVDTGVDNDEEESDPAWPHLRGIYEIFLQLIINEACDAKLIKGYITTNFINEFLQLFDSAEIEERDFLKNILHKLYHKIVPRRRMMRKAMTDCFQILIHDIHKFNGASELLDILASIISGFAVPLRQEHIIFFKNIIIPLHKVQTFSFYYENLIRCSILFLNKDSSLSYSLLEGILKYWPFANHIKEAIFLQELSEIFEYCEPDKIKCLIPRLFKRIINCMSCSHLQVSDRSMCLFESESFIQIIKNNKQIVFPMIVPIINNLADNHWHKMLNIALKEILIKIDCKSYEAALDNSDIKKLDRSLRVYQPLDERSKIDQKWKSFLNIAKKKNPSYTEPIVPFHDDVVLYDFNSVYKNIYNKEKFLV